jgi:hypothetical protein
VVADVRGSTVFIGSDRQNLTGSDTNDGTSWGSRRSKWEQCDLTRHGLDKIAWFGQVVVVEPIWLLMRGAGPAALRFNSWCCCWESVPAVRSRLTCVATSGLSFTLVAQESSGQRLGQSVSAGPADAF